MIPGALLQAAHSMGVCGGHRTPVATSSFAPDTLTHQPCGPQTRFLVLSALLLGLPLQLSEM